MRALVDGSVPFLLYSGCRAGVGVAAAVYESVHQGRPPNCFSLFPLPAYAVPTSAFLLALSIMPRCTIIRCCLQCCSILILLVMSTMLFFIVLLVLSTMLLCVVPLVLSIVMVVRCAGSIDVGDGSVTGRGSGDQRYHDPLYLCFCLPRLPQLWRHLVSPLPAYPIITVTTLMMVT